MGSLVDVGAIIKTGWEERVTPLHIKPWLGAGAWVLPLLCCLAVDPRVCLCLFLTSDQKSPKSITGWICAQPMHASFFAFKITSSHLALLTIQLCDVNGISLQKKEMRLASVLPGKESELGPTLCSPMLPPQSTQGPSA